MYMMKCINQNIYDIVYVIFVYRREDQVDGVEQSLTPYCDVERDVRLGWLGTCNRQLTMDNCGDMHSTIENCTGQNLILLIAASHHF